MFVTMLVPMHSAPSRNSVRNSFLRTGDMGQKIVGTRRFPRAQLPDGTVA
jgi:hypothetical protein